MGTAFGTDLTYDFIHFTQEVYMNPSPRFNDIFDNLDRWRHFPAYQLERRADIFCSIYLPGFIEQQLGGSVRSIIPEFPIHIGTIRPENNSGHRSYKIDYLIRMAGNETVYFLELKTDTNSRSEAQVEMMEVARAANIPKLLKGVLDCYAASDDQPKYRCLMDELNHAGFVDSYDESYAIRDAQYKIELLFLQPEDRSKPRKTNEFTLGMFADYVHGIDDPLSRRFAHSLRNWNSIKAGTEASKN